MKRIGFLACYIYTCKYADLRVIWNSELVLQDIPYIAKCKYLEHNTNLWITLEILWSLERKKKVDAQLFLKRVFNYAGIDCIHAVWKKGFDKLIFLFSM